ncbi:MAG TPA: ABC transporter permease [Byssovorax sp.]|jgi:peptide/nickel transport system permease protein
MRRALVRVAWALVVVFGVTSASFAVALLLPGDPARMLAGAQAAPADVARVREAYGLDRPAWVQYGKYLTRVLHVGPRLVAGQKPPPEHATCGALGPVHVDLGFSAHYRRPVVDLLAQRAPRSIELGVVALALQLVVGGALGLIAAARRGSWVDEAATGVALASVSAPTFVIGLALQYVLAYRLRALPYDGFGATGVEHARSLVLPALTLGVFGAALYARLVREEVGQALDADAARTARAKGASRLRVVVVHALRIALLPIATLAALDLGALVGGAVVTEKLFRWPGVGQLAVDALVNRDGPVIVGTVLFGATAMVMSLLALDLASRWLDPRVR